MIPGKISVVVPIYKVEQYLPRCIDSIRAQTYRDLEILLVDDGSPDGSGAICDRYAAMDSRIRVIHKENGGLSSARNAGIDAAQGEFIAFVDSDDWLEPQGYAVLLQAMQSHGVPMAVGGRRDVSEKTGERRISLCPQKEQVLTGEELARRIFLWEGADSSACDKLYRRELFDGIRYPLGITSEDVPVTYRLALRAEWIVMVPVAFYNYYHRVGSISYSGVKASIFDFANSAMQMETVIRADYPNLVQPVAYLKTRAFAYSVQQLEIGTPEDRRKFAAELRKYRRLLRGQLAFILHSDLFSGRERRDFVMLALNIYRLPRAFYHALRG